MANVTNCIIPSATGKKKECNRTAGHAGAHSPKK